MATSSETPQPPFYGMVRTQGISDSIFSMTLILLVFGLDVPSPGPNLPSLGAALAEYSPELIGYAVGSLFVGMMWIAHHHLLNAYKCVNTIFMAINFVFLTVVMCVPYFLGLMTLYLNTGDGRAAALLYSGYALISILLFQMVMRYGLHARLMSDDADPHELEGLFHNMNLMVALYVGAVIISLISPMLTMLAHIGTAIAVIGLLIWNAQQRVPQPVLSTQSSD